MNRFFDKVYKAGGIVVFFVFIFIVTIRYSTLQERFIFNPVASKKEKENYLRKKITTRDGKSLYYKMISKEDDIDDIISNNVKNCKEVVESKNIMLCFHGNGESIEHKLESYGYIINHINLFKMNVLFGGYRHEFSSEKIKSETQFYNDAEDLLTEIIEKGYKVENIFLFGRSLGSAAAIYLASKYNVGGLIVESSFCDLYDFSLMKYLPSFLLWTIDKFIMRYELNNYEKIGRVKCPILILHGENDHLFDFAYAQKLAKNALNSSNCEFYLYSGSHYGLIEYERENYQNKINDFLNSCKKINSPKTQ